jgi:membrane protein YdbS with pleckstrin-like domain
METSSMAHPLARQFGRDRRLVISLEVALFAAMVATIWATVVTGGWSWWHVLPIAVIVLLGAVVHLYAVVGFTLDEHDHPITGRDADQFALWKLDSHKRHN